VRNQKVYVTRSSGGLASGLEGAFKKYGLVWLGWPGGIYEEEQTQELVKQRLKKDNLYPVFLSADEGQNFYEGYSNSVLWPICHYFPQNVCYEHRFWESYEQVNQKFMHYLLDVYNLYEEGDIIWVHDYHLMLLPNILRKKLPTSTIGYFHHIPFPSFEIFRILRHRQELVWGLLGADLIGFHTHSDVHHFLSCTGRLAGLYHRLSELVINYRSIRVDAIPIGVDYNRLATATKRKAVQKQVQFYKEEFAGGKILLSIDRLDFSKGILQRLQAFRRFLQLNPDYMQKVTLVMVVVPSRDTVESYARLKREVDELVGNINSQYSTLTWRPILYLYKSQDFDTLCALYHLADVCLVTPLRDGMNLVSKEYVACSVDNRGVLVLSEMAGAAESLTQALRVNPFDIDDTATRIKEGLEMAEDEQASRMLELRANVKKYDSLQWFNNFMEQLQEVKQKQVAIYQKVLLKKDDDLIVRRFYNAKNRLIFLDYDGTLVSFTKHASEAQPDAEVLSIVKRLAEIPNNHVAIISGRHRLAMDEWLGDLKVEFLAEHGAWRKELGGRWRKLENLDDDWKTRIRPIMETYVERTPGSYIEEKSFSLAWHFRVTDNYLGNLRALELADTLQYITANLGLQILHGSKVIEIKSAKISKGSAAQSLMDRGRWDLVLAIGDDMTDEDTFKAVGPGAIRIKVGEPSANAEYVLSSVTDVRRLLTHLVEAGEKSVLAMDSKPHV